MLVALALVVLVFGDALFQWSQVFLGTQGVDAWGTQWFYWYVGEQASQGKGLGQTDLFFYPWGKDVYLHTGANVLDAFLAWPLRWVLGPVAGYNLFVLLVLGANALAARQLAQVVGVKDPAAALAGVFFTLNPFLLGELDGGRPTQVLVAFVLLFWAEFLRLEQRPRTSVALRAGIWLGLAALTYWYYAIFSGMVAALYTLIGGWKALRIRIVAGLLSVLVVLPFALPMLQAEDVPGMLDLEGWSLRTWSPNTVEGVSIGIYSVDFLQRASGFWAARSDGTLDFLPEAVPFLRVQVVLLLLGFFGRGVPRRWLLSMLLVGGLIAIGPQLVEGVTNPVYLWMVTAVKVFRRLWWPQRAMILVQVALCVAAAVALRRLWAWKPLGLASTAAIAWAWYADLRAGDLAPFHFWPSGVPLAYSCLAEAEEGAIIELPYADTQAHLYYQTRHGRPMFGGMVEDNPVFTPEEQTAFRRDNSFVAMLVNQAKSPDGAPDFVVEDFQAVGELGYKWVILDKNAYLGPGHEFAKVSPALEGRLPLIRRSFNKLFGAPVYEDSKTSIWAPWGDPSPCGKKNLEKEQTTRTPKPPPPAGKAR